MFFLGFIRFYNVYFIFYLFYLHCTFFRKSTCVQTEEISNSGTRSVPEKEQKSDKNTPAAARHKTQATDKDKKTSFAIQTEEIQPAVLGKEPVPTQEIGHMDLKQAKNTDKGVKGAVKPNQTELVKKDCGPAPTPASSSVNKPPVDTRTALEDSSLHVIGKKINYTFVQLTLKPNLKK